MSLSQLTSFSPLIQNYAVVVNHETAFLFRCLDFDLDSNLYITEGLGVCNNLSANAPNISQATLKEIEMSTAGIPSLWYRDPDSDTGNQHFGSDITPLYFVLEWSDLMCIICDILIRFRI